MKKLKRKEVREAKRERRNKEERDRITVIATAWAMQMSASEAEHHAVIGDIAGSLNDRIRQVEGALDARIEELAVLATYVWQIAPAKELTDAPVDVRNICMEYRRVEP